MIEQAPTSPAVTVAVVSWNTRDLLAQCLESLHPDVDDGLAEVWVVDNASTDGSAELVREGFPWANVIASEQNLGFGAGVNRIAAATSTPWIAPANADVRVSRGALRALIDEGVRHPDAAVLAPRLTLPDGSTQHSVYPFPTIPFTLAYLGGATRVSRRAARHWFIDGGFDPGEQREIPWAVGAFVVVRRDAWEQVGGFDAQQWMYAEDLDLGWRLTRHGWKARYVPGAEVFHAESAATTQAWGGERHARWHGSTYLWMLRRRGAAYTRLIAAANVIGFLARAGLLSLRAASRGAPVRGAGQSALLAARAHAVGLRSRRALERLR